MTFRLGGGRSIQLSYRGLQDATDVASTLYQWAPRNLSTHSEKARKTIAKLIYRFLYTATKAHSKET